ncbi:hypothetical protein GCM10022631_26300 [Deinococcus rubellus]
MHIFKVKNNRGQAREECGERVSHALSVQRLARLKLIKMRLRPDRERLWAGQTAEQRGQRRQDMKCERAGHGLP